MAVTAAVVLLAPVRARPWLGLLQPFAPLQWGLSSATRVGLRNVAGGAGDSPLARENEELRRQLAHQSVRLAELERRVEELARLRNELGPRAGQVLVAGVVAADTSPLGQTLTIALGSRGGARAGQWVAAGGEARSKDAEEGTGWERVARQHLIGQIVDVAPYVSRVRLCTHPQFGPVRVSVARARSDGSWSETRGEYALYGIGEGRMEIREVPENLLQSGYTIVLAPLTPGSAVRLTLGRVVAAHRHPRAPLHYNLQVVPWAHPGRLGHVYVIDLAP